MNNILHVNYTNSVDTQVLLTHFQSWYVTFYYEPAAYGMLSEDFFKYDPLTPSTSVKNSVSEEPTGDLPHRFVVGTKQERS